MSKGKSSPTLIDAALGARLRARRFDLKMSQGELARLMRTSAELVEKYETGVRRLRGPALTRACRALGIAPEYLMDAGIELPAAGNWFDAGAMDILANWQRIKGGSLSPYVSRMMDALAACGDIERAPSLRPNEYDLLNALPVAIYTTDADGHITYFNEAAVALAGRRPRLMIDRWCVTWRLYWPDGRYLPHAQCPMAIALRENRIIRGISAIVERPDGSRITCVPHPTPLRDASGAVAAGINLLLEMPSPPKADVPSRGDVLLH